MIIFAKRNLKEILRDPVSLAFLIGLPLFLLIIFQQFKIPSEVYSINNFAPSIVIFSFTFITLFTSLLVSSDRSSSFLSRLYASCLKPSEFMLGYSLSLLPIALIQGIIFFSVSLLFGLKLTLGVILSILISIPMSLLFIALGLLIGSICTEKQAPAISSIVVQLVAFTSGMWFDTSMVGGVISFISSILPFKYALDLLRKILLEDFSKMLIPSIVLIIYIIVTYIVSILVFKKNMLSESRN